MRERDAVNLSLGERLKALPEAEPPRDAWPAIRARLERRRRLRPQWPALGLAAAVVLGVSLWLGLGPRQEPALEQQPVTTETAWLARSQQLEQELQRIRDRGGVMNGGEAAVVAELEDRITLVDMQLAGGGLSRDEAEQLWRRRVGLLAELVAVRSDRVAVVETGNYVL